METTSLRAADEDDIKIDMTEEGKVDLQERDPNKINHHLKVTFDEVFAEPHSDIHSFDKIWGLSFTLYTGSKLWCYRITTAICGIPCSICWGLTFALLNFVHIWCCVPTLKVTFINLHCVKILFDIIMETFIAPLFMVAGKLCSSIRITMVRE